MVWTSANGSKCPVSPADRGEYMKPSPDAGLPTAADVRGIIPLAMTPAQDNCFCSPRHNPECAYMKGGYCTMTPAQGATALADCPFCAKPLYQKRGKINPYAKCKTEGCFGGKMPVISLDVPSDIEAWNTRAMPQTPDAGEVQDTWFTDSRLPIMAMSGDHESDRVLKLHFRRKVNDSDRARLIEVLNAGETALSTPSASAGPQGEAVAWQPGRSIEDRARDLLEAELKADPAQPTVAALRAVAVALRGELECIEALRAVWDDWTIANDESGMDDYEIKDTAPETIQQVQSALRGRLYAPESAHPQPQQADTIAWLCEYDGHTDATTDPDTVRIWRETLGRKITPLGPQQAEGRDGEINHYETTSAGVIDWKMEAERANRLLASAIDQEKFCIAFGWAYGTAIEKQYSAGREPRDGLTPKTLWAKSSEQDRNFMRGVVRETFAALSQAPATDGAKLPPDWKQDQAETSRLAPSHTRPECK